MEITAKMLRTVSDTKPYVTHYYIFSMGSSGLQGKIFMWKESMHRYLKSNNNGFTAGYVFGQKNRKMQENVLRTGL